MPKIIFPIIKIFCVVMSVFKIQLFKFKKLTWKCKQVQMLTWTGIIDMRPS